MPGAGADPHDGTCFCPDVAAGNAAGRVVLDRSTSMQRTIGAGTQTKDDAAFAAARAFLSRLTLTGDRRRRGDQVAIVGFNRTGWIEQALTAARGTTPFSIGLGRPSDIDAVLLGAAAGDAKRFFAAPLTDDLGRIYAAIATVITTCR